MGGLLLDANEDLHGARSSPARNANHFAIACHLQRDQLHERNLASARSRASSDAAGDWQHTAHLQDRASWVVTSSKKNKQVKHPEPHSKIFWYRRNNLASARWSDAHQQHHRQPSRQCHNASVPENFLDADTNRFMILKLHT